MYMYAQKRQITNDTIIHVRQNRVNSLFLLKQWFVTRKITSYTARHDSLIKHSVLSYLLYLLKNGHLKWRRVKIQCHHYGNGNRKNSTAQNIHTTYTTQTCTVLMYMPTITAGLMISTHTHKSILNRNVLHRIMLDKKKAWTHTCISQTINFQVQNTVSHYKSLMAISIL